MLFRGFGLTRFGLAGSTVLFSSKSLMFGESRHFSDVSLTPSSDYAV